MAINFQPSCECIRLIFLKLFAVSFMIFLLVIITFAPSNVMFHITGSSLTRFNLTSNTVLDYKLEVNITSRNPNKNMEMYYRTIIAIAWHLDNDFARVSSSSFDQEDHKNTTFLNVASEGKSVIKLKPAQLLEYHEERHFEIYNGSFFDLLWYLIINFF